MGKFMHWRTLTLVIAFTGRSFAQAPDFDAKSLLYLQDGDYSLAGNKPDMVGAFGFPLKLSESRKPSEQNISNSMVNNHRITALRSDRKAAYILETRGALRKGSSSLEDMAAGAYVSVVKFQEPALLKPDYRFPVAEHPTALVLDPGNKYLAVSSNSPGNELQIFELDDFGKPLRLLPTVLHLEPGAIQDIIWHPNRNFLIYIRKEDKELGLIRVVWDKSKIIRLEQIGETVKFEGRPSQGAFSKDGKYFFLVDEGLEKEKGKVFVLRLSTEENGKHQLLTRTDVGIGPVQLSVHPSGDYVFVSTLGSKEEMAAVSILHWKGESMEVKTELHLDGVHPSAVKFDKSGKNFAVSVLQSRNFGKPIGQIYFYKFTSGKAEKQAGSIITSAGVHQIDVLP
jgi:hypothetical protein